jgi:uncharacterized membrane protein
MTDDDTGGTGDAERLTLFTDAVVAIAMTLLALDLHVPVGRGNADFWHDLTRHSTDYVAFLISFAVIGGYWLLHRRLFGLVARVNNWLIRWNMLWLLTIVLTPFATRVIVSDDAFAAQFTLYAVLQIFAAAFFLLAVVEMDRSRLTRPGTDRDMLVHTYVRLSIIAALFLVSIPLAFVTHWAYAFWIVMPFALRIIERVRRARRPGAAGRAVVRDRR